MRPRPSSTLCSHPGRHRVQLRRPLDWQKDAGSSSDAHRVESRLETGGLLDEECWPEIQDGMVDAMIRLERAMRPHIARLQVQEP
jgi:hypothetical protein